MRSSWYTCAGKDNEDVEATTDEDDGATTDDHNKGAENDAQVIVINAGVVLSVVHASDSQPSDSRRAGTHRSKARHATTAH